MHARLGLLFWTLGILFPLAWLGKSSPAYRRAFDTVFGPEWMHVLMHLALFAGLGVLLVSALKATHPWRAVLTTTGFILVVAVLQEGFQALSQGVSLGQVELLRRAAFDLGVDLAGGLAGLYSMLLLRQRTHPLSSPHRSKQE
jgi:hypothetical protein